MWRINFYALDQHYDIVLTNWTNVLNRLKSSLFISSMENCSVFTVFHLLHLNSMDGRLRFWITNASEYRDHFVSINFVAKVKIKKLTRFIRKFLFFGIKLFLENFHKSLIFVRESVFYFFR